MRRVIPIPDDEAAFLASAPLMLRRERAVALVRAGWSYTAVSAALGTPRSTLQHWVEKDPTSTEPVPSPPPPPPRPHPRAPLPPISQADATALATLLPLASRNRKGSSQAASQAAEICNEIVLRLSQQGYTPSVIADQAGLTQQQVKSRLQTAKRKASRS